MSEAVIRLLEKEKGKCLHMGKQRTTRICTDNQEEKKTRCLQSTYVVFKKSGMKMIIYRH